MKKLYLLASFVFSLQSFAQNIEPTYFNHFTKEEGVPSNYVEQITQDSDGFMWFGTGEGLCRYDGYSFLKLVHSPQDSTSLINNCVTCFAEDKKHNLWIGTIGGLSYLDLNTYKFKRFTKELKDNVGTSRIYSLCFADDDQLFIGTMLKGAFLLNTKKGTVSNFCSTKSSSSISSNTVNAVFKVGKESVWLGTDEGLDLFDLKTKGFKHIVTGEKIWDLTLDKNGKIVCVSDSHIFTIDPLTCKQIKAESIPNENEKRRRKIVCDMDNNLWISTSGNGIYMKNKLGHIENHFYDKYNAYGLNSNSALSIYEDKTGNIWIGTFDAGVNVLYKQRKPFVKISCNFLSNGLQSNHVRSIWQDRDGEIWIGTKTGGMLSLFDRKTCTFTHYRFPTPKDEAILCITDAQAGFLWVGALENGLNLFNKKTGTFSSIPFHPEDPNGISSNVIEALLNDGNRDLWIGHMDKGLDIYHTEKKTFSHLSSTPLAGSLTDNRVRVIFKDSNADIWVGTMDGLNLYDRKTGKFKAFLNKSNIKTNISSIYEDHQHQIWVGASNGLYLLNKDKKTFTVFNKDNGYPANTVKAIGEDNEGSLWMSSDDGIIKFDPQKRTFRTYTKEDGVMSNELMPYSYCKTKAGELFFGTDNGFNIFDPSKIKDNTTPPQVVLTKFLLFNQEVEIAGENSPLKNLITRTKKITLTYKQSVFTFEFAALNFASPEKNQYAYKMNGFDKEWNRVGTKRSATYTNLPAGHYTFSVMASNNDGAWNEKGTQLYITILPPPWKTWWAYLIYTLIIAVALYKYRNHTVKRIQEEKERDLDQMKLNLFVNVSHEFRTPLTLMQNPLEKIQQSGDIAEIHSLAKMAQRSSSKLLNLVNQLLDFRKLDQGKTKMTVSPINIVSFCQQVYEIFDDLAKAKNIHLVFEPKSKDILVWLDPDKLDKMMNNLLSNAMKFTESNGRITIGIDMVEEQKNGKKRRQAESFAEIRVSDTGIGLKEDQLNSIFERFYQVDSNKVGTGIGLNYVKNLVELHGGKILIESVYGQGSTFRLRFPLGKEHYQSNNIQLIENDNFEYKHDKLSNEAFLYDVENTDDSSLDEEEDGDNAKDLSRKLVVLIVEDSKSLRIQIRKELENKYIVREASNGLDGCEKALKYIPDLIVSDIMMPKMNGIELCKQLKSTIESCHIPIILLTAKGTTDDKIVGFETGADEYMQKPFSMKLLEVRIQNLIQNRMTLRNKYLESKTLAPSKNFTSNNLDEVFLEKMTNLVLENIANPKFQLDELREKMGMSQTSMFVKLQTLTGLNPSGFVRTVRLKYAEKLLIQNEKSIKSICYECGFNSPAYFAKTFKELYGETPSDHLENHLKRNI